VTALLGKPVNFVCLTKGAQQWEWRFGETGKVDSKTQNSIYTYKTPGLKTVSLILNGNYKYIAKNTIYVQAPEVPKNIAKPLPKPAAKTEPVIPQSADDYSTYDKMKTVQVVVQEKEKIMSNDELSAAIINFARNKTKLSQFNASLCGKVETTTIEANGKLTSFSDFLDKIKGQSITISKINTIRETSGCINQIIIKYKK
jgi:PKD repeat protein